MAFEINPLNQPLADGSGLTRLVKQKTCQFAISLKVVVCAMFGHNVPDHSSMLPCSGKGHLDSLSFFLSLSDMLLTAMQVSTDNDVTQHLPSQKLWRKMLLKSRKGVLKNGESRGTKEKEGGREAKDKMNDWKDGNRSKKGPACILLVAINIRNQQASPSAVINSWGIRASESCPSPSKCLLMSFCHRWQTDKDRAAANIRSPWEALAQSVLGQSSHTTG